MGADLVSMCVVHRDGPLTQKDYEAGIEYLTKLREQVAALHAPDFDVEDKQDLPETPITNIIIQVAECEGADYTEAIHLILQMTAKPEEIVQPLSGARDLGGRPWNGAMIYYAGQLSWGDEPDGLGYQAMKWLFLLDADKVMGLE